MRLRLTLVVLAATYGSCVWGQDKDSVNPSAESQAFAIARATANQMHAYALAPEKRTELALSGPQYTFTDPARQISSGTIWMWSNGGRPAAIMSLCSMKKLRYLEFCSFSDGTLEFTGLFGERWRPAPAWKPIAMAGALPPDKSSQRRLSQLKELAARFRASAVRPSTGRTELLRVLPRPIYRYSENSYPQDGAIFLVVRDGDPEAALVIETTQQDNSYTGWQFMAGNLTKNIASIFLDEQEFKLDNASGEALPYQMIRRTAEPDEL